MESQNQMNMKAISTMASVIIIVVILVAAGVGGYFAYTTYFATSSTISGVSGPPITIATAFGVPDYSDVPSVYAITVESHQFGISMQEQIYTGTTPALAALISGQAEILDTGAPAVLAAVAQGNQSIVAFGAGESAQDLSLVCAGNITSASQLVASSTPSQNPTVGVTTLGDTSQYPIAVWLTNQGLNPNNANWQLVAGSSNRLSELLSNKIACGGVDIGGTALLLSQGNKFHVLASFASMLPKGFPLEVLFTTKSFLASHESQLVDVVKAFMASNRYFQSEQNYLGYAPSIVQNVNQSSFGPAYNVCQQEDIFDPNAPWSTTIASAIANLTATYKIDNVNTYLNPSTWANFTFYQTALTQLGTATSTSTASSSTT